MLKEGTSCPVKLGLKPYPERKLFGVQKFRNQCPVCPYIKDSNQKKRSDLNKEITDTINCNTNKKVYLIECNKPNYNQRYIGEKSYA